MAGTFAPGQKITIRTLASALGISPTPAREALGQLAALGALEFDGNRSVLVPVLNEQDVAELYKIRMAIEGISAEEAGQNLIPEDANTLSEIQLELVAAMDRGEFKAVLEANERFHFFIYERSNTVRLLRIIEGAWLQMGPTLNLLYPAYQKIRKGLTHHSHAIDAVRRGDPQALKHAILDDLDDGRALLSQQLALTGTQSETVN